MLVLLFWKKQFLSAKQAAGGMPLPVVETSNKTLYNIKDEELPKAFKPTPIRRRQVQLSVIPQNSLRVSLHAAAMQKSTTLQILWNAFKLSIFLRWACMRSSLVSLFSAESNGSNGSARVGCIPLSIPGSNVFNVHVWCVVGNFVVLWLRWCYRLTCPLTSNKLKTWKQLSAYEKG